MRGFNLFLSAIILGGCATMMSGPVDTIEVSSKADQKVNVIVNGVPFNSLPLRTYVSLEEDVKIEWLGPNAEKSEKILKRHINPWGLLNVFNLFLGVAVDYSNGSFWALDENKVEI